MTIDARSGRTSAAPPKGGRQRNMIMVWIGLGTLYRLLRNHRFHIFAVTAAVGLAAMSRLAQENQAKSMERLVAWAKKQDARLEKKVKHVEGQVKGALPGSD
jgi:hypothetical protein